MSHLAAWLRRQNNSNIVSSSSSSPSHVFLNGGNGGKVYLSDAVETRKAFMDAYASDVISGTPLYVVERTDASYRMFADFDIMLETTRLPTTHLPTLIDHALSSFPAHLPGDVVSICVREAHGGKVGAHMIWRDLRVDDAGARSIRDAWVAALDDADAGAGADVGADADADAGAEAEAENAWDATIDAAVYKRNGLRMPWSRKRDDVAGIGVYTPTHTWTLENGLMPWMSWMSSSIPKTHAAVLEALERCSILATSAPPPPLPSFDVLSSRSEPPSSRTRISTRRMLPEGPRHQTTTTSMSVVKDALIHMGLDETTPTRIHADDPGRCILFSCMPPSRTCRIAYREHKSNHIYYQMLWDYVRNEWHLRQRCHSLNCSDRYCSLGYILPQGHACAYAETTRAASSTRRAIANMADRWMAKMQ